MGGPHRSDFRISIVPIADHRVTVLPYSGKWYKVQHLTWAADGNHLFATAWPDANSAQGILLLDPLGNSRLFTEIAGSTGWLADMRASPDGHYLACTERIFDSNVMPLEDF